MNKRQPLDLALTLSLALTFGLAIALGLDLTLGLSLTLDLALILFVLNVAALLLWRPPMRRGVERKKPADENVRPEELGFGTLFEKVRDAVIVADTKTGRIVLWNPAAATMFGYSSSEALGLYVDALVPERFKAQHRAGLARYRKRGKGHYIDTHTVLDLPAVTKAGKEIRIELSLSPLGPSKGAKEYVLAIIRDITARNRVEELAAQLLGHLSGNLGPEPDTVQVPGVSSEVRVPLEETQIPRLTSREHQVLQLLVLGKGNREIATELRISMSTVKTHVEHILAKLAVSDRAHAAIRAVELGLVTRRSA